MRLHGGPTGGRSRSQRESYSAGIWTALVAAALLGCTSQWPASVEAQINPAELAVLQDLQNAWKRTFDGWNSDWGNLEDGNGYWPTGLKVDPSGSIYEMSLAGYGLTGSIPESIGSLQSLEYMNLARNRLTGSIPGSIGNLWHLHYLYLESNELTGNIPPSMGSLQLLRRLDLSTNKLTGTIPSELRTLYRLAYLTLGSNRLTGNIPPSMGDMGYLRYVDLSSNQITGTIPWQLGDMIYLYQLYLGDNQLTGNIPTSIATLELLSYLDLSFNQINGSIPWELGNLRQLYRLDLSSNQIFGTIPWQLGNLINLENLDLSQNFLSGAIPGTLGNLQQLNTLNLAGSYSTSRCPASRSLCWVDPAPLSFKQSLFCTSICPTFCNNCVPGFPNVTESNGLAAELKQLNGKRNPNFRYASLLMAPDRPRFVDWRMSGHVFSIKDQANCSSCWAFSTIASLESAIAISHGRLPVSLSEQQLLDCMGIPEHDCSGGLAEVALNYIANMSASNSLRGVFPADFFPYRASSGPCTQVSERLVPTPIMVTMYEEVDYFGWIGITLAVQKQPVIANLHGSYPTFMNYDGTDDIYADGDCAQGVVDHSVVIVGYDLTSSPPYWIIRNSAGPLWGRKGYMNIGIQNGNGVCDIQSSPVLYPVITLAKPCASPLQPCGGGVCLVDDNGENNPPRPGYNRCVCPEGFVSVTNIDKSTSCAPVDVCNFYTRNPCGTGTCINDERGGYQCVCPLGYIPGRMASDNTTTCVPGVTLTNMNITYTVGISGITCATVAAVYGLSEEQLRRANNLERAICLNLPINTRINISRAGLLPNCNVRYSWSKGDTCKIVANLTSVGETRLRALNPWLNCSAKRPSSPGAQLCLNTSSLVDTSGMLPRCTVHVPVNGTDTCASIIKKFQLPPLKFFQLNPGLFCDSIGALSNHSAELPPIEEVCVDGGMQGVQQCKSGYSTYRVTARDSCIRILSFFFGGKVSLMNAANGNWQCTSKDLYNGRTICIPCTLARGGCPRAPPPKSKKAAIKA